jgi:UDP-N-acetylglucosamine 2-epimerase (non-hydrolysing)/GDP/UDP-N,N'-diacetylbacillosamine 2-epimerase (hydrolysing)
MIEEFVQKHPLNSKLAPNLTHQEYIRLMQQAALVLGNSSAGIIEAPWIGIPTVNLGYRQSGRPMARSVFGLGEGKSKDILNIIKYAMSFEGDPEPEYVGGAAPKIAKKIRNFLNG